MQNSKRKEIANGDYVFVYNIDNKRIECVLRIDSKSENNELIWKDEKESNSIRYKNRWNAHLISDRLNIDRSELLNYSPFNKEVNRFNLLVRNPFPNYLDEKYNDLSSFLLAKVSHNVSSSPHANNGDLKPNTKQYYLIQVNERGSKNLLENNTYQHIGWNDTPRDIDHGKVREGDILLVYFARNSIEHKQYLKKIYLVNSVSGDNTTFKVKELKDLQGISLNDIKNGIEEGKVSNSFNKLGQQGFNITKIEKPDYDSVLKLDNEKNQGENVTGPNLWLVRAGDKGQGEQIALERDLVGIGYGGLPGLESIKDFKKFRQHYIDTHRKDKIGHINAVVPQIWKFMNEIKIDDFVVLPLKTQKSRVIAVGKIEGDYQFEDLNSEIKQFRSVRWLKKDVPRDQFDSDIAKFLGARARGTVNHIGGPEAVDKIKAMLTRLEVPNNDKIKPIKKSWLSLNYQEIQEIVDKVLRGEGKRLEIERTVVERIISHLIVSKHVILVGPPGTGKTDLGRRLLRELGERIIGKQLPVEAVASYEWGRYEVIGGNSIITNSEQNLFHPGCVTDAILQGKFLLIDEFNRADMNKDFGEMFMALDHGVIQLRRDETIKESNNDLKEIKIPHHFRMICTMNDYDKALLNELSYGLLRRFAYVEINVPKDKQLVRDVIIERVKGDLAGLDANTISKSLSEIQPQVDKFIDFMFAIRSKREIGLSSYIDVIRYLLHGVSIMKSEPWQNLDDALIDYILPQFDRLNTSTLNSAYELALENFGDESKKTPPGLDPFINSLKDKIDRLQSLNKLFNVTE